MKKIIPFLFLLITGCSSVGGAVAVLNPLGFISTGFYPLLIISELETNFSSVLIDKTKAKVEKITVSPFEILPEGSSIYIMPVVMEKITGKSFDTYYSKMIGNYILMNNYARTVTDIEKADYILRADISESAERTIGKNFSRIQITIMEQNESPVFYANVSIISKSDKNFYYYPSKSALPVKELTLYGLEEMFANALPKAFGNQQEG